MTYSCRIKNQPQRVEKLDKIKECQHWGWMYVVSHFSRGKLVKEGIKNKPQEAQIPKVDLFEECADHTQERNL